MAKKKKLHVSDFAGDGGPFSEVVVTISIRILDDSVSRSRLAVNIVPDPALEAMARERFKGEQCGYNEEGIFGLTLAENFSGWEDMENDFPRMDTDIMNGFKKECAERMNALITRSVRWALDLNLKGMKEAGLEPRHRTIQ